MRFLLDENMSAATALLLRAAGHDVAAVQDIDPGISDVDVIAMARADDRVLVTFDSDIGERLFHHRDAPPPGVLYLRFVQPDEEAASRLILDRIASGTAMIGSYTTFRGNGIRQRPLPR